MTKRKLLIIPVLLTALTACTVPEPRVSMEHLEKLQDRWYVDNVPVPFSGTAVEYYDNGQLYTERTFVDGVLEGDFVIWYKDGNLKKRGTYKAGRLHGLMQWYYPDGSKEGEAVLTDGSVSSGPVRRDETSQRLR